MKVFRSAIQSIHQNRLRSILAGFGIAWGIFLLVILLGVGGGFKVGVMKMFNAFAQKSLFVYAGRTSVASDKLNNDTQIVFDGDIVGEIRNRYGCVVSCSAEMSSAPLDMSWNGETMTASVKGVHADYFDIRILGIKDGRDIRNMDDLKSRNVAVIGEGIKKALFGREDAIGKMIDMDGNLFKVVGVLSSDDLFSMQERNSVYVPASSFVNCFYSDGKVSSFCLSLSSEANTSAIENDLKGYLAYNYGFDPHDEQAIYVSNIEMQTKAFESLFNGLEALIWITGICLLLSGIVGVCNVMLIIVKERTNEIGIRKAVGATSESIISMILAESVAITFIAGFVGIVLGMLVVLLANSVILPMLDTNIMDNLQINIPALAMAFMVLCLSGIIAGLFPALKASQISPADAIRYENRG